MNHNLTISILITFISVICISCGSVNNQYYSRNSEQGMPSGPGCYAKCLISNTYKYESVGIYEYTGKDFDNEFVEEIMIQTEPSTAEWIKKKADINCRPANPDDCLVWCLVETEPEFQSYYVVKDTSQVKEFLELSVEQKWVDKQGGFTEWKEIVCAKDQTTEFYEDVQYALRQNNYDLNGSRPGIFDKATKEALKQFQKDNNLPMGNLDLETVGALGVEY